MELGRRAAAPGAGAPNSLATAQARELVAQAPERPSRHALGPLHQPKYCCAHSGGRRAPEPSVRASPGHAQMAACAATGVQVVLCEEDAAPSELLGTETDPFLQRSQRVGPAPGLLGASLWLGAALAAPLGGTRIPARREGFSAPAPAGSTPSFLPFKRGAWEIPGAAPRAWEISGLFLHPAQQLGAVLGQDPQGFSTLFRWKLKPSLLPCLPHTLPAEKNPRTRCKPGLALSRPQQVAETFPPARCF